MGLVLLTALLFSDLSQSKQLQCEGAAVVGRYMNYAEGFSVELPRGLEGRSGQAAGPERGVSVPLSPGCEGVVVLYGQANSLEWETPEDAITWQARSAASDDSQVRITRYKHKLGPLNAAGITMRSPQTGEIRDVVVAFRPGGGPVYFATLDTTSGRYAEDRRAFEQLLRGFRLEEWR